jgi:hypothetical protein
LWHLISLIYGSTKIQSLIIIISIIGLCKNSYMKLIVLGGKFIDLSILLVLYITTTYIICLFKVIISNLVSIKKLLTSKIQINHWIYTCLLKLPLWHENWSTTACIDLVAAAISCPSEHYVEFKVPTTSHKSIAFLEFSFLLAIFYILLIIIRLLWVTNNRIKECLSTAMQIEQRVAMMLE